LKPAPAAREFINNYCMGRPAHADGLRARALFYRGAASPPSETALPRVPVAAAVGLAFSPCGLNHGVCARQGPRDRVPRDLFWRPSLATSSVAAPGAPWGRPEVGPDALEAVCERGMLCACRLEGPPAGSVPADSLRCELGNSFFDASGLGAHHLAEGPQPRACLVAYPPHLPARLHVRLVHCRRPRLALVPDPYPAHGCRARGLAPLRPSRLAASNLGHRCATPFT